MTIQRQARKEAFYEMEAKCRIIGSRICSEGCDWRPYFFFVVLPGNCAHYQKGGWWYNACAHSNLNGVWYRGGHYRSRYQDGVYWAEFRGGAYSLKKVVMMIRPNPNTFH